jgi:hypothetical protein
MFVAQVEALDREIATLKAELDTATREAETPARHKGRNK